MGKELTFLSAVLSILFLNSCAVVPAALIGGGGTLYGVHKEAKAHYPDVVPGLPVLPDFQNFSKASTDHTELKSSVDINQKYGFDCTKQKNDKNQSECFDQFAKSLSEKENSDKIHQKGIAPKGDKEALVQEKNPTRSYKKTKDMTRTVVVPQEEIAESDFFEKAEPDPDMKKTKVTKKQHVAQILRNNPEVSKLETRPQEIVPAVTKSNQLPEFVSSHLLNWVKAWQSQDIDSYISLYSKDFTGAKRSHSKWEAQRHRALKTNSNISIEVSDIQIYQSDNTVEVNFTQRFKSDRFSDIGIKELIWAKNESGWKIIKETWMPKEKTSWAKKSDNLKNFISTQLLNWVNAWGNQNINLYMSFYSKDFTGTKKTRSEWGTHRNHALKTNSNMSIQVSNIQLHVNKNTIEVNFTQRFKSDRFSDVGIKELIWKKMGSDWKILKETWLPS